MIKKEELRLGSVVLCIEEMDYDERELYVERISEESVSLANSHAIYTVDWKHVHPAQVYSWHLEPAGFTKKEGEVYVRGEWEVDCMKDIATWKGVHAFKVKYVHELQNLLLAVSGIDLDLRSIF